MKAIPTPRGVRLEQGGAVLSEILREPGPTHSIFDLLAALVVELAPGPRVALLGFAGGGVVGPLRALGWAGRVIAVDLDPRGEAIFRRVTGEPVERVAFVQDDAVAWLRRSRGRFDAIVEDLSVDGLEGETKPAVSLEAVPTGLARRLGRGGVAVFNLLPVPGVPRTEVAALCGAPFARRITVVPQEWENRILVAGATLPGPRVLGAAVRRRLRALGSDMAQGLRFEAPGGRSRA